MTWSRVGYLTTSAVCVLPLFLIAVMLYLLDIVHDIMRVLHARPIAWILAAVILNVSDVCWNFSEYMVQWGNDLRAARQGTGSDV